MKRVKKRMLDVILMLMLGIFLMPGYSSAEVLDGSIFENTDTNINKNAVLSNNAIKNNYLYWSKPVASYLYEVSGGFERIEFTGDTENQAYDVLYGTDDSKKEIIVEKYSEDYQYQSRITIDMELPLFGGCYCGKNYNYIFYGQTNKEENNSKEVIRIVKYSKTWERLNSVGVFGANTTVPFDGGTVSCTEKEGYLYVRTSHEMYTSADGVNHQANMAFIVKEASMVITDSQYEVLNHGQSSWGYVSHSFNQLLLADENDIISVDHGDSYPRTVVLDKFPALASDFSSSQQKRTYANILELRGNTGDNNTDASVGGLEASDSFYFVVGNYLKNTTDSYRSIWLSVVSKEDVTIKKLSYITDGTSSVTTPEIIKINNNGFMVAWNEYDYSENTVDNWNDKKTYYCGDCHLNYVFIDGMGNQVSEIISSEENIYLSDCKPLVKNNKVIWYATVNTTPIFYEINIDNYSENIRPVFKNIFFKHYNESDDYNLFYIGENGTAIQDQLFEVGDKKYISDEMGIIYIGYCKYKGNYYCAKEDGSLACNEFIEITGGMIEPMAYAASDNTLLTNSSKVYKDTKYYFGKQGYAVNSYKIKNKKTLIQYKIDADDKYNVFNSKNVTIPKKVVIKKGKKIYLCNIDSWSIDIMDIEGDWYGYKKGYDGDFEYYKVYKNTTFKVQLKMNGKTRTYKIKVKVK
jgi:hypothetical protein